MRAVVQRVSEARVKVGGSIVGEISTGFLVLLAIHQNDREPLIAKMCDKLTGLRIFNDASGKMNLSLKDVGGEILVVSQFTLYADAQKGNRPSFGAAAPADKAEAFYDKFVTYLKENRYKVETGKFGAEMTVELVNEGPVTIILESN